MKENYINLQREPSFNESGGEMNENKKKQDLFEGYEIANYFNVDSTREMHKYIVYQKDGSIRKIAAHNLRHIDSQFGIKPKEDNSIIRELGSDELIWNENKKKWEENKK